MGNTDKPLPAQIVKVVQQKREGISGEAIIVRFNFDGKSREEDFASPLLTEESMLLWRRITLSVILNQRGINVSDGRIQNFEEYQKAVDQKEVFIAFDGAEVYAIGSDPKQMFFPYEYGLWD